MSNPFRLYGRRIYSILKQFKIKGLVTAFTSGAEFSQLIKPLGERPLILSAHPGEEMMAIGGTMAWYAKLAVPMTVLTFSDGRHGTNTGRIDPSLPAKRRKEQLAAFTLMQEGLNPIFWDLEEHFAVDQELIFSLLEVLDELNPDIIYTPSLFDDHPDSQSISYALAKTLERLPSPRLKKIWISQYELWTPIVPNKILNIDEFIELKRKAIECHESQLLCRDYLEAMMGLNRYRAAILGAGNHAEASYLCKAAQYCAFLEQTPTPVLEPV